MEMIREQINNNENMTPNGREISLFKNIFPNFFDVNGNFLMDRFQKMLNSNEVTVTKEGYELNFLGKSYGRFQTSTGSETVISPLIEHNRKGENKDSENLYIIGDNLDALKHLLKSYSRKVKCIYIDPPYNTGSDGFIYSDDFKYNAQILSERMGIDLDEANRIIDMRGKSTHSAWLSFMYPRLVLARDLLREDGVIFISVDDNEQANLKLICDEIFGEENFLTMITRATGTPTGGGFDGFVNELDYCLVYSRDIASTVIHGLPMDNNSAEIYNEVDEDGNRFLSRSLRRTGGEDRREDRPTMFYPIIDPDGDDVYPYGPTGYESRWMCSYEKYKSLEKQGLIIWKNIDKNGVKRWHPYQKFYLEGRTKQSGNIWKFLDITDELWDENVGNKKATLEVKNLLKGKYFETPKPVELMVKIQRISLEPDSLILDFFSGSATTAHAVMKLNAEDGGNRKYILVQKPEEIQDSKPAAKAGYKTIDEIGRERIKQAAAKIKAETRADIDYGFKLVKLSKISENTLDKLERFNPDTLVPEDPVAYFEDSVCSGLDTILTTWLNQDGYGLHAKWQDVKLENYTSQIYENTLYLINDGIESQDVKRLIEMVENNDLNINRIVYYPYSFPHGVLIELKNNIKNLRNGKEVTINERY